MERAECIGEKNLLTLERKNRKGIWCGLELGETGAQFFLERLRVLLALAGRPRFRLLFRAPGLTVGLAVGGAVSTGVEVAVGLSGFSLWKVLTSLRRCWMAEAGSQVFSSSGKFFQEIR